MGLPLEVMTKSFSSDSAFYTEADWLRNSRTLTKRITISCSLCVQNRIYDSNMRVERYR